MLLDSYSVGSLRELFVTAAAITAIHTLVLGIYRLFFSPLAKFPGPPLAAATGWYEFYYDVIQGGTFVHKIVDLHAHYGPIIRINPWELHVSDPEFYSTVYVSGSTRRTGMFPRQRAGLGVTDSHNASESHDLHRLRRKPLDLFFSRQNIERMESMIVREATMMDDRFTSLRGTKTVINLEHVFAAVTGDIIAEVCTDEPISLLQDPEFSPHWFVPGRCAVLGHLLIDLKRRGTNLQPCLRYQMIYKCLSVSPLFLHFSWLVNVIELLPLRFLLRFQNGGASFREYIELARKHITDAKSEHATSIATSIKSESRVLVKDGQQEADNLPDLKPRGSLVRYILSSADMPPSEKSTARLARELMLILGAGTVTTMRALNLVTFHVLSNKHIEARLREDLKQVMAEYRPKSGVQAARMPTWAELEKRPYLAACIKEGLRLSFGIMRRLPRTAPDVVLQYKQWTIPKNTPVGMSAFMMHTDSEVFSDPFKFHPERWLGDYSPRMNRNFVPFTKGSRNCLGLNLVQAEMNLVIALLFRPGGPKMTLYQTEESDVALHLDWVIPVPKADSRGTRVVME